MTRKGQITLPSEMRTALGIDEGAYLEVTAATRTLQQLGQRPVQPLLTNFSVAESHALALSRLGADIARRWLLANAWRVERVNADDELKARSIIASHTDTTYSYTDATSFAVLERLRAPRTAIQSCAIPSVRGSSFSRNFRSIRTASAC